MDEVKNNFVVYTALFGTYDDLNEPKKDYDGCDFICFTDQKHLKSDIWEIRLVDDLDLPSNMINRKFKILPHLYLSEYEYSMYVDSNIKIIANPKDLANKYLTLYDFVLPKHFVRDCIYKEAIECININKTNYKETTNQIQHYKQQGFPKNYGLGENNILLRKHNNDAVKKLMNDWWTELNNYTKRDQLSLAYVHWKNNRFMQYMDESARGSSYFRIKLHNHEKIKGLFSNIYNLNKEFIYNYPNSYITKYLKKIKNIFK